MVADLENIQAINTEDEIGAYESLWLKKGASYKKIAENFSAYPDSKPSDLVDLVEARSCFNRVHVTLESAGIARSTGAHLRNACHYMPKMSDAVHPVELMYYRGAWDLIEWQKSVAIVGTRNPTREGVIRARKLAKMLVENGYVVVSGLAKGIDYAAHSAAIEAKGRTVSVIGTPIVQAYPKENEKLQEEIAREHLLISPVPILRYQQQNFQSKRMFFPERNKVMSALSDATVIVEAGETSGTLVQARAAIAQGRPLFIMESCFQNSSITWPAHFEKQGAHRLRNFEDIIGVIGE